MPQRAVFPLIEDNAHNSFLNVCKEKLITKLNEECGDLELRLPLPKNCNGIENLLNNELPSALAFPAKRYLLLIDLDYRTEQEVFSLVADTLRRTRTKGSGSLGQPNSIGAASVSVTEEWGNVIKVKVRAMEKIITILPLGIPDLLPNRIKSHSVEDYSLLPFENQIPKVVEGVRSKDFLTSLIEDMKIAQAIIDEARRTSIESQANIIQNYLRPLWTEACRSTA
jgi:hypothetical protein